MKKKVILLFCTLSIFLNAMLISMLVFSTVSNKKPNRIFKKNINSIVELKASTEGVGDSFGTGVIYTYDGFLITNAHVISYSSLGNVKLFEDFKIRFALDSHYQNISLIKYNLDIDIAIFKIDYQSNNYTPIVFSKKEYDYGDKVFAMGNTSNYGISISEGIISVPEVNVNYENVVRTVIQADINVSSGNSGGALLDNQGNLVGITSFRTKNSQGIVNFGFAYSVPLRILKNYVEE